MNELNSAEVQPGHETHVKHYDPVGARLGMWIFLYTEILLFGGLFIVYIMYTHVYKKQFIAGSEDLNLVFGTVNTLILLTSSLTMVLSIAMIQKARNKAAVAYLIATILCGLVFLFIKLFFEWAHEREIGIWPGNPIFQSKEHGIIMFYSLYFVMTGLHGIHVLVGIGLLSVLIPMILNGKIHSKRYLLLENSGLYWHLVDIIWIFLFPLFYLII